MNLKRILFIIMCVLLALTITLTGLMINRVSNMLQGGKPPVSVTEGNTDAPTDESPTGETQPPTDGEKPTGEAPTEGVHEHEMVKHSVNYPGCTQYGWTVFKCSCGKTSTGEFKDPLGHNYDAGKIIAPTCTESGHTVFTCSRCDHVETRNVTEPLGHDFTVAAGEFDATCEEDAYVLRSCAHTGCDETEKELILNTALGHNWEEIPDSHTEPTCTEAGKTSFVCKTEGCGENKEEVVPPLGHDLGQWSPDADSQTSCQRPGCAVTVQESAMMITKESSSTDGNCTHYMIEVGTQEAGCLYIYEVLDYLACEPSFSYETGVGLKVNYGDGQSETLALHANAQFTIEEETPSEPDEGSDESN